MDEEKDTPGTKPPGGDEDIVIEFVDHEEPAAPPAPPAPREAVPETGIVEIDVDAEEAREAEKEEELGRLQDQLLRSRADFQNYKRRVERDRGEDARNAAARTVREFLPVQDSLDRAVSALASEAPPGWCKGLELVRQQFQDVLLHLGVRRIEALGKPFDPSQHDAVMTAWDPAQPAGTILSVFEEGYEIDGKLLRPTRVSVNRRPEEPAEEEPGA